MKQKVIKVLQNAFKELKIESELDLNSLIKTPKNFINGDFTFPCFLIAKSLNKNSVEIAKELKEKIKNIPEGFSQIQIAGPYLNFYLDKKLLIKNLIKEIEEKGNKFGRKEKNKEKIVIEFPSPNTNKPLHLGHLRNMAIGESISRIGEANGFEIIRTNLNNDRGIHICKSMLAYKLWGTKKTPRSENKKSDHFVGDYYVKFAKKAKRNKELEKTAQKMLRKWERGDRKIIKLWKKINYWALNGFQETYKQFGIKIDKNYFESLIYKKGRELVEEGLKKGIFEKRKDGAVIINLKEEELGEKVLLRSDGTSIYITQDIYLAKLKFNEFSPTKSIYVTGNEQNRHFNILFSILDKLKIVDRKKLSHLSYGMVNLPNGRMKSREGTVVDADDLMSELQKIVKKELKKRNEIEEKELENSSMKIALAALKYFLLKVDIKRDITFNPEESIVFEGDTGPYCQYSYARASSILRKSKKSQNLIFPELLEEKEIELILKLNDYKKVVEQSYSSMNPTIIANYAYSLSKTFNEFYHSCSVINSTYSDFRLEITKSFRQILKNALYLIGIDVIEVM